MTETRPAATRTIRPPDGYQLAASVGLLAMGAHDPCARFVNGAFWWATRTQAGPATFALRRTGGELLACGYGPGADWVVQRADAIAGLRDDLTGFASLAAGHPVVAELAHTHRGLRLPATGQILGTVAIRAASPHTTASRTATAAPAPSAVRSPTPRTTRPC